MTDEAAIEAALARDPYDPAALIARADCFHAAGDTRAAAAHYSSALRNAGRVAMTPTLRDNLQRAQAALRGYAQAYEGRLAERLVALGQSPDDHSSRMGQALDLLFGRAQVQLQQPSVFYFPELPQVQVYDRASLPWAAAIEAAFPAVRAEAEALLQADRAAFQPYVQTEANRPADERRGLKSDAGWTAWHLTENGDPTEEARARCPATLQALQSAPLCTIPGRTPSILFSLLKPGARIAPHHGFTNTRLICHLPLIVPPGCGLRVGNQTRAWREGELLVFDDTMEHEAWNNSGQDRLVLIFDVWRPELTEMERRQVSTLFETADSFGMGGGAWSA